MRRKILGVILGALLLIVFTNIESLAQDWRRLRITWDDVLKYGATAKRNVTITGLDNTNNLSVGDPNSPGILRIGLNNEIWIDGNTGAENTLAINYRGEDDGLTQYRDIRIYDGKGVEILLIDGSAHNVASTGTFQTSGNATVGGVLNLGDDLQWSTANGASIQDVPAWTQIVYRVGSGFNRGFVIGDTAISANYDHAIQTNPTLWIQSAVNPDTDNTQWVSLVHDQTNGVISTGKGLLKFNPASGGTIATPPAAETIAAAATITANGCGTIKQITAAGAVTTNTTNTFTAPAAANNGCCMDVINVGANAITLDNNALFVSAGAADVVLGAGDTCRVASNGSAWYQIGATGNN